MVHHFETDPNRDGAARVKATYEKDIGPTCINCPIYGKAGHVAVNLVMNVKYDGLSEDDANKKSTEIADDVHHSCLIGPTVRGSDFPHLTCSYGRRH